MLQEKIARLPPMLRQEVEDYVDFLLQRYGEYSKNNTVIPPLNPIILAEERALTHEEGENASSDEFRGLDVSQAAGDSDTGKSTDILEWVN